MKTPVLPKPLVLGRWLRSLAFALRKLGARGQYVSLCLTHGREWQLEIRNREGYGWEFVPADGRKFEALKSARRLLLAAENGERADGVDELPSEMAARIEREIEALTRRPGDLGVSDEFKALVVANAEVGGYGSI